MEEVEGHPEVGEASAIEVVEAVLEEVVAVRREEVVLVVGEEEQGVARTQISHHEGAVRTGHRSGVRRCGELVAVQSRYPENDCPFVFKHWHWRKSKSRDCFA